MHDPHPANHPNQPAQPPISSNDIYLFNEGTHCRLYRHLGAHLRHENGQDGVRFTVWAPNARQVSVIGDFNGWNPEAHHLHAVESSGLWSAFVPGVHPAASYKFNIRSHHHGYEVQKCDPFAFHAETPPNTASKVWKLDYQWNDDEWMAARPGTDYYGKPMSIYEMHAGSWKGVPEDRGRSLSYREMARDLPPYLKDLGFTHVELMPIMEHPLLQSWGYQTTGYFAPTSRYGTPQDFMFLVDTLHQHGIGVILDWVPSHFPLDQHALSFFDGTHLYEHSDPRQGFHPDWTTGIFNYTRHEVRSFLLSSACFWLDYYHADALRVDAVASMLYLDYSRKSGEWIPNQHGGNENLEAIDFLKQLNATVYREHPGICTFAEESTAWGGVSRPVHTGGLGFGFKWDMGWMNDTLRYFTKEPVHRRFHHNDLTFRAIYAFSENYILPLSHDEVVHGKGSLLTKMPGDEWQKFANLRLLLANQWFSPAKKLLFMGAELGQWDEWTCERSMDWHLAEHGLHKSMQDFVRALNAVYAAEPALHKLDCDPAGFEWVHHHDADTSVIAFLRLAPGEDGRLRRVLCAFNHTPVPRPGYRLGVPAGGTWKRIFSTDDPAFGGSGFASSQHELYPENQGEHGRPASVVLDLPPLGGVAFLHVP